LVSEASHGLEVGEVGQIFMLIEMKLPFVAEMELVSLVVNELKSGHESYSF
jgi:hypothetical protein